MNPISYATSQYNRIKNFYFRYERLLMPIGLVGGFLMDYFTFTTIQISITFTLLCVYWFLAGTSILIINSYEAEKLSGAFKYIRLFIPVVVQFTFGALLGSSLIFYWFSGAFSVSWPLIALIALLMVFNEVFRNYLNNTLVQIGVYFFASVSLLSLILPYIFTSLSAWLFVAAGIISLAIFIPYAYAICLIKRYTVQQAIPLFSTIMVIFAVMNIFYFADITPPIPLALREAGLYHTLSVSNGKYTMKGEPEYFLQNFFGGQTVHLAPGEKLYAYTAIFAPAELQTTIIHHWQYYDTLQKDWVTKSKLPFTINGGRREGYKAYSFNTNLQAGRWRVHIENTRGQVLGNIPFTVERVQETPLLQEVVR